MIMKIALETLPELQVLDSSEYETLLSGSMSVCVCVYECMKGGQKFPSYEGSQTLPIHSEQRKTVQKCDYCLCYGKILMLPL
jgi:hypothetical protein